MAPTCTSVDCGELPDPLNGQVTHLTTTFGSLATYSCDADFSLIGSSFRICTADGTWSNEEPICTSVACDSDVTTFRGQMYQWRQSMIGEVLSLRCPELTGNITRQCGAGGEWQTPNTSACISAEEALSLVFNPSVNLTESNFEEVLSNVTVILESTENSTDDQTVEVLQDASSFIEELASVVTELEQVSPSIIENLVTGVSSIQQFPLSVTQQSDDTSIIAESLEDIVESAASMLNVSTNITVIEEDQIILTARNVIVDDLVSSGQRASLGDNRVEIDEDSSSLPASISLPSEIFSSIMKDMSNVGVFYILYTEPTLFPLRINDTAVSASSDGGGRRPAIASPVIGASVGEDLIFSDLSSPVEIVLSLTGSVTNENVIAADSAQCVFWNFTAANGQGNWSSEGCVAIITSASNMVTCRCTHLTNFAILVDICSRSQPGECETNDAVERALSSITYIGIAASLVGLLLTIITLLLFKTLRSRDATKFHIQLCIAIGLMLVVFAVGINRTKLYPVCATVSVLIHYFTLASILWMCAEACFIFHKLVFVFTKVTRTKIILASMACWGLPLVSVTIPLVVDLVPGNDASSDLIIERGQYCFLSDNTVFWAAFLGPIFAIILLNVFIYIVVVTKVIHHKRRSKNRQGNTIDIKGALRLMVSTIGISFLFGLSWLFAALTIIDEGVQLTFQFLFAIFTSFQGFFIFLFFCILSVDARESWKQLLSCGRYKSHHLNPQLKQKAKVGESKPQQQNGPGTLSSSFENSSRVFTVSNRFSSTDVVFTNPIYEDQIPSSNMRISSTNVASTNPLCENPNPSAPPL